jgi:hypothetical protein
MKSHVMRVLGMLMGVAWIVFGMFLLFRYGFEDKARAFAAVSMIGAGLYFVNYAFTGRSTFRKRKRN